MTFALLLQLFHIAIQYNACPGVQSLFYNFRHSRQKTKLNILELSRDMFLLTHFFGINCCFRLKSRFYDSKNISPTIPCVFTMKNRVFLDKSFAKRQHGLKTRFYGVGEYWKIWKLPTVLQTCLVWCKLTSSFSFFFKRFYQNSSMLSRDIRLQTEWNSRVLTPLFRCHYVCPFKFSLYGKVFFKFWKMFNESLGETKGIF